MDLARETGSVNSGRASRPKIGRPMKYLAPDFDSAALITIDTQVDTLDRRPQVQTPGADRAQVREADRILDEGAEVPWVANALQLSEATYRR